MGKVLAGIGIVAVTVIGGFLIYSALNETEEQATPSPDTTTSAQGTSSPSPTPAIPGDWETYTSETHNFTIAHPDDMNVSTTQTGAVSFTIYGPSQRQGTEVYDGILLNIETDEHNTDSLQEFVEQERTNTLNEPTNPEVGQISPITLAGRQGFQYTVSSLGDFTHIYLPLQGSNYVHIYYLLEDPEEQGFEQTLDMMFSSLQFSNQ